MTETALPPDYPVQWEADVVLRDGSVAHLRPIKPSDADLVRRFHAGQSDESIYLRFFAPLRQLSDHDVERFTNVDYSDRVALVATMRSDIIGIGRYDRIDDSTAEVAFNISDHYQGRGIGSVLLEHLAAIAQEEGISAFLAEVLPQNRKMLSVFADAGYAVSRHIEDGVVTVRFDIKPTEQSMAVRMSREHRAEAVSVQALLFPASIAVVGASRREESIGHRVLRHILDAGFTGPVQAVNPGATEVLGVPAYPRVGDIPGQVDLAVVAVPADAVMDVVEDCARSGVKSLLVVSAGFAEAGPEGAELQDRLLRAARDSGMRVVGPNSFGIMNNDPGVRLNATLAPNLPPFGQLGLFSQSGALGIAVLSSAARRNLGVSVFASAGNRADVSGNDLMQYWIDDRSTHAVGLYLESMGNPRKFSRIARALAMIKPVIVVKSGFAGYGLPPGHRVRVTRARPEAFPAMLRQAGVIRVENVHQLFDVAQLVVHQPLPTGSRVAVVGNSAQLSALTADSCDSWGLTVAHGPVSVRAEATAEELREALRAALGAPDVDSVIICFIPPLASQDEEVLEVIRECVAKTDKTCLGTLLGLRGVDSGSTSMGLDEASEGPTRAIPLYAMPEDAVRALAAATKYARWRAKDHGVPVDPAGVDRASADALVDRVLAEHPEGRALSEEESRELLAAYGITLWPRIEVASADEAVEAARSVGLPVVLKSLAPSVRGKSVLDGIRVDLTTESAVREAYASLNDRLAPLDANYFVVQGMAPPGVACVVSSNEDPLFGPVVSFSIAGPPTDLLGDIGHRIPPLTDVDVSELISSVRAAPLLHGHRGSTPVHRAALADLIARVSVMADNLPELDSLTFNPVMAHPAGVEVLGAEIHLAPPPRRQDPGRRSLT